MKNPDAINYRNLGSLEVPPHPLKTSPVQRGLITLTYGDQIFHYRRDIDESYNKALEAAIAMANEALNEEKKLYRFEYEFKVDGKEETRTESIFSVYEDGRDQADYLCKHFNLIRFERSDIDDDGWGS